MTKIIFDFDEFKNFIKSIDWGTFDEGYNIDLDGVITIIRTTQESPYSPILRAYEEKIKGEIIK